MHKTAVKWFGLMLMVVLTFSSCSNAGPTRVPPTTPRAPTSNTTSPSLRPTTEATNPVRNDLSKGRTKRALRAGGVRVTVAYAVETPIDKWRPEVSQPIMVGISAVTADKHRIYLAKVTGDVTLSDEAGPLQAQQPLLDEANIIPGYLVTRPAAYNQVFMLQPLPIEATTLTIDFRYEMLILERDSTPREYAKRAITDTVVLHR